MNNMAPQAPVPKPHDPRMPSMTVDNLREEYDAALVADPQLPEQGASGEESPVPEPAAVELARYEAAYGVLASALQDGE